MKRTLVLFAVLLLAGTLAWTEGLAAAEATEASGAPPVAEMVEAGGGGCMLPDLAGLSAEDLPSSCIEKTV